MTFRSNLYDIPRFSIRNGLFNELLSHVYPQNPSCEVHRFTTTRRAKRGLGPHFDLWGKCSTLHRPPGGWPLIRSVYPFVPRDAPGINVALSYAHLFTYLPKNRPCLYTKILKFYIGNMYWVISRYTKAKKERYTKPQSFTTYCGGLKEDDA